MGAGQSSDKGGNASKNSATIKTSYYELLGVEHQATEDEIKKAYRRKALELHPDRNYGKVDETTALFAEVQSAYEILSDPQERAWYDSHEDAILRDVDPTTGGGSGGKYERNVGLTTADDITRMIGRFHGGVEFSDAPSGFYGFLRETFDNLAREEQNAARQVGSEEVDYPSFGHKDDRHEDVVKTFYAAWTGFSTKKSFSWRDQYSTRGVGDRRTRRVIEKENKRLRDEAIREFNDAVRSLIAFVKKRDPRYKPNTQSEAERQKALREATAAQAARQRAANAATIDPDAVPEWAKTREPDELEESEEEESEEEQFECVACRKIFKSENQFEAHERSKKHQKAVHALRRKLQKEGVELDLDDEEMSNDTEQNTGHHTPASEHDSVEENDLELTSSMTTLQVNDETDAAKLKPEAIDETAPAPVEEAKPESATDSDRDSSNDSEEDDENTNTPSASDITAATSATDSELLNEPKSSAPQPKMGKAAQKRAKKAAQNPALADQPGHKCMSCNAVFPSKTRLFQHIKDFGHAAPASMAKGKGKKGKAK